MSSELDNILTQIGDLKASMEKRAFLPPGAMDPQAQQQQGAPMPPEQAAAMQGAQPMPAGPEVPPMPPEQAAAMQGPPPAGPDPMMEVMNALEQMATVVDQMAQRNQAMEQQIQGYEAKLGQVDGKYSMLMDVLKQQPAPALGM